VLLVWILVLVAAGAAGCGSQGKSSTGSSSTTTTAQVSGVPVASVKKCLRSHGYTVSPESAKDIGTAPDNFEFVAVWNLLNPGNVALALTISKSTAGATRAAVWTRAENTKLGKGVVGAPVFRIGRVDLLWTSPPSHGVLAVVTGCVRPG
jgi:hypothetical protein